MLKTDKAVLLVEPDPDLRSAICELLEVFGYHVLAASNLEKAILSFEQNEARIVCLVVAAFMPNASGLEVVDAIAGIGHPLPTLLLSVFAADKDMQRRMASGEVDFLAVPFSPESFKHKLKEVLDRAAVEPDADERLSM